MSTLILCGIYRIRNTVNGKVYVGSAVDLRRRWRGHRRHLNKGAHHCRHLQRAWVKHGEIAFVFELIEAVERDKAALVSREQWHLDRALTSGLAYNASPTAGSTLGQRRSFTAQHCASLSLALKGRPGSIPSAETRAKRSLALKGRAQPAEAVRKRALARTGKKLSAEWCANISKAQKASAVVVENCKRLSLAQKGVPLSFEHRENIRLAGLGRAVSTDTRQRISVTLMGHEVSADTR